MIRVGNLLAGLSLALLASCATAPVIDGVASSKDGMFEGHVIDGVNVFKGIPYAEAPVGDLRWRPPVPKAAPAETFRATQFGPACIQPRPRSESIYANPPERISEDCLFLNIWAPPEAKDAPVFVWIHGGSLTAGYSHEPVYDGSKFAEEGLIVVSINYRLGVLGYLAHPELSAESPDDISGNYGLLDQIEALSWVQKNIAAFGGDPANVTVAGESAGALSVLYLMASPNARGLFQKAVLQSSYMVSMPALKTPQNGHFAGEAIGLYVAGATGAADLAGLRAMDAEKLTVDAAMAAFMPLGTVDGKVLPRQLIETFDVGEQAPVPVIAGFNSGEIRSLRFLMPPVPRNAATYENEIRERYDDLADAFLKIYPSDDLEEAVLAAPRDSLYGWTANRLVRDQTALGQASFLYYFDHTYPAADKLDMRGFHAAELPYVFGTADRTPPFWPGVPDTSAEQNLAFAMSGYWASFAHSGVPSAEGAANWKAFGADKPVLVIDGAPRSETNILPGMFALHDETVCRRRADGTQQWNWNTGIVAPKLPPAIEGCS
ncbi:MAG: carboxylesterase family protein [Hyphomonas sp.]